MARTKRKYYLTGECVFSTLEQALQNAKEKGMCEIYISELNATEPLKVGVIDSYTDDVNFL